MKLYIYTFFIYILLVSCNGKESSILPEPEGWPLTDSVATILKRANLEKSTYQNKIRIEAISKSLKAQPQNLSMMFHLAKEYLNAGQTQKAITTIEQVFAMNKGLNIINDDNKFLHEFLAICYLRIGEQVNCLDNHSDESCIVPITGQGVHKDINGSKMAMAKYEEILNLYPEDNQSRWLYNVASMTLNLHDEIPKNLYIDIPKKGNYIFENIASRIGVDHFGLSGGVIIDDFNNDGLLDIITSTWGLDGEIVMYQNNGKDGFVNVSGQAGLELIKGGLNIKQADYNNDGWLDILILRGAWRPSLSWGVLPNSLLKNNGDGTFTDVTVPANIYSSYPTQSAEWFDFNNDGWLDLFIANESPNPTQEAFPCELYRNNKDGSFTNIAKELGVNTIGYFKGCAIGDVNNDNLQDIYLSNLRGDNVLFLNQGVKNGSWSFVDIAKQANVTKPFAGFPCWFADLNNDGYDDIFNFAYPVESFTNLSGEFVNDLLSIKSNVDRSTIYINNGNNTFNNNADEYLPNNIIGTMGCNFGDINNDGLIDIYLANGSPDFRSVIPNQLFVQNEDHTFNNETYNYGVGHIQKGHGVAITDLDNDGDQDIYAVMGGAFEGDKFHNALFNNPSTDFSFLKIRLKGYNSNLNGLRAKVKCTLECPKGTKTIYRTINSGSSFGANPLMASFNFESKYKVNDISINWPNGDNQYISYGSLVKNNVYLISEKTEPIISIINMPSYKWKEKENNNGQHH